MPTVKLLRTTMGGTEFINLTSALLGPFFAFVDISVQVDDIVSTFSTANSPDPAVPFVAGSLKVWLGGTLQNGYSGVTITEHPGSGTFDLNFVPLTTRDLPMVISFVVA